MCGFVGILRFDDAMGTEVLREDAWRMVGRLAHRGPDDAGVWADNIAGVALAHRRLSILDLSPEGHQPMVSHCGRYIIVFNGEIYNYKALREDIALSVTDIKWRGHTDTEVLLAAIAHFGVRETVERSNGMFAFALWDRVQRRLYLARDRMGEKPLYYGHLGGSLVFGSELKALSAHRAFNGEIDREALALYFRYGYIPGPYSIYKGICKLPPGHLLHVDMENRKYVQESYWSAREAAEKGRVSPFTGNLNEATNALDGLLTETVGMRMLADVPLGAFLSGGVDSSTVVALMQAQSDRPIKTFSIGFREQAFNEADHARAIAVHLGTDHVELGVSSEDALRIIPQIPHCYDEPFADPSQIPTMLVSELARRHVTVSLSGDGGDELFAGYNRYLWGTKIWGRIGWLPAYVRQIAAAGVLAVSPRTWDSLLRPVEGLLPEELQRGRGGDRIHKTADILAANTPEDLYFRLISHWTRPGLVLSQGRDSARPLVDGVNWNSTGDFTSGMMLADMLAYLPDDILVKLDRASMSVSLEGRVPLLDHRVVEFAWSLPMSMKIHQGKGKWILRKVLDRYVPEELVDRKKMGFGVPTGAWLRGPLRDWAEDLLSAERIKEDGYLDAAYVRGVWKEHISGRRNWDERLWDVLMFQAWLEVQKSESGMREDHKDFAAALNDDADVAPPQEANFTK